MSAYIWPLVSVVVMLILAVSFYLFEKRRVIAEKAVLMAILSALASVGRLLLVAIPNVQPSSFIIIVAGLTLGAETGFMTGALTALLSGLLLGIGPWTPWQMFAWGMMGMLAGLLKKPLSQSKLLRVVYGVAWGLLFGWIMNLWMLMSVESTETGFIYFLTLCAASFLFDSLHALANGLLILFGGNAFIKVLKRIGIKYGLTN